MTNRFNLEELLTDFIRSTGETIELIHQVFGKTDLGARFFGCDPMTATAYTDTSKEHSELRERIRSSSPWNALLALHDYAVHGISHDHPIDVVGCASEIIGLLSNEMHSISRTWRRILNMANGRHGLDEGMDIDINQLALLASVDIRTVRNAASSGELLTYKKNVDDETHFIFADNISCKRWLLGRRGFVPTKTDDLSSLDLKTVSSTVLLSASLKQRRELIGLTLDENSLSKSFPDLNVQALIELESGVFSLPLSATRSISDFYAVDHKDLLRCVMRTFFSDALDVLKEDFKQSKRTAVR